MSAQDGKTISDNCFSPVRNKQHMSFFTQFPAEKILACFEKVCLFAVCMLLVKSQIGLTILAHQQLLVFAFSFQNLFFPADIAYRANKFQSER